MPKISNKGSRMPESPIRKLAPYAEKARETGKKIYLLNIGQPDIETPEIAMDAARKNKIKVLEYSHSAGHYSYREKLAGYYKKHDIHLSPEDIMITTGGSEAISFALNSCLDAGDELIIPEPFYANYNGFAKASDITIKPITSYIEKNFALPSMDEFEKLITSYTRGILICNPSNPTGYLYSKEELETLRDIVLKHDLFLFADEVYREFCYDGSRHFSVLNFEELKEHVVVVDSISKRYSACGARIGALITRNKEVFSTALKFAQARLSPPTLEQLIGEAALDVPESYFQKVTEEYGKRRNILIDALNKMEGVICPVPKGAFYAMAELPVDDTETFCQWMLESFEYKGATVMMAPAEGFYATESLGKKQVRIAYVLKEDDLVKAMECLAEGLKQYPGNTLKTSAAAEQVLGK